MSYQSSTPYLKKSSLSEKFGPNSPNRTSVSNQSRSQSRGNYKRSEKRHDLLRGDNQKKTFKTRVKLVMAFLKAKETIENFYDEINPGFKRIRKVLQNHVKTTDDAKCIRDYIRNFAFFINLANSYSDLEEKALVELCKHIKSEYHLAASFVFREDDPSNEKVYIIFKGSVSVIKKQNKNNLAENGEEFMDFVKQDSNINVLRDEGGGLNSGRSSVSVESNHETSRIKRNTKHKHSFFKFEKYVKIDRMQVLLETLISNEGAKQKDLKIGEGFGDHILSDAQSSRPYSILTNTNCEFMVINRKIFAEILKKYDKKRRIKSDFMEKKIPFLDSIASHDVWDTLHSLLIDIEYPKGTTIVSEDSPGNKIFFLREGECQLEKTIVFRKSNNSETVRTKKIIAKLGPGACFGEELLMQEESIYTYSVKVFPYFEKSRLIRPQVISSSALFCSVEIPILLARFPQQCTQSLKENFLIKEEKIHSKKINRIVQDIQESLLSEQKPIVKFSLDNNSSPPDNLNLFRPKLYGRTHVAASVERKKLELNEETPKYLSRDASPMNKDDYYLFPKPEKPSAKIRAKLVDSSPKKLLRESAKTPKAKMEAEIFGNIHVANPHVLLRKASTNKETAKWFKNTSMDKKDQSQSTTMLLRNITSQMKEKRNPQTPSNALNITASNCHNIDDHLDTPKHYWPKEATLPLMKLNHDPDDSMNVHGEPSMDSSPSKFFVLKKDSSKKIFSHTNSFYGALSSNYRRSSRSNQNSVVTFHRKGSAVDSENSVDNDQTSLLSPHSPSKFESFTPKANEPIRAMKGLKHTASLKSFVQNLKKTFAGQKSVDIFDPIDFINNSMRAKDPIISPHDQVSNASTRQPKSSVRGPVKEIFAVQNPVIVQRRSSIDNKTPISLQRSRTSSKSNLSTTTVLQSSFAIKTKSPSVEKLIKFQKLKKDNSTSMLPLKLI